jgi:hypothetical protein
MVRRTAIIAAASPAARIVPVLAPDTPCAAAAVCPPRRPRVLTASALLQARPGLGALLGAAGREVRTVARWADLLNAVAEEMAADVEYTGVALVDLDAANLAAQGRAALSGYRLLALLARHTRGGAFGLVVQTALDYSEIEDVARLGGVCALAHPHLADEQIAERIHRALRRWATPALPRTDAAVPATADTTLAAAPTWAVDGWPGRDAALTAPAFG